MPARSSPSCRRACCSASAGVCARRRISAAITSSSGSGTGGMGEVWRAEHRLLARDAAIKLVRPEVLGARDESEARLTLKRFEREAQATAALSSPHTIQVFDFGITQDGTFYYVMELLAGRDLESLVREFGPLPPNRVDLPAAPGVPLAGRCARARAGASRHQAGQHLCLPHGPRLRLRQGARLRAGQDSGGPDARGRRRWRRWTNTTPGRRPTWRPKSSSATRTSIGGPTSMPSAASPTSCSPASWCSRRTPR